MFKGISAVFIGRQKGGKMEKERNENDDELTPEVIGKLLEEDNLSEEELNAVLKSVKIFCKVAYEIFAEQESDHEKKIIQLHNDDELKEAA